MPDLRGHHDRLVRPATPIRVPRLKLRVGRWSPDPVLVVTGEIDLATIEQLRECLALLEGRVVVDLYAVSFLDASGLGVFAEARTRLRANGGDLRLRSPQDQVRRVLDIVGLDDWIISPRTRADTGSAA